MHDRPAQYEVRSFDKIVDDEDDYIGMIAYAIYKKEKIHWISSTEEQKGRPVTQEEIEEYFYSAAHRPEKLHSYRESAVTFLNDALMEQAEIIAQELVEENIEEIQGSFLSTILSDNLKKVWGDTTHDRWWALGIGVMSSIIATLIIALLAWLFVASPYLSDQPTITPTKTVE
ncbi:MAG: hypothetical protein VXZ45_03925 [Verrucomicrobiota bacterium]|nr:hypothetical protein [Pseudomonadota bacterium]MEC8330260.1 hypothetical protein [Verrucomicrobiota bacterium]